MSQRGRRVVWCLLHKRRGEHGARVTARQLVTIALASCHISRLHGTTNRRRLCPTAGNCKISAPRAPESTENRGRPRPKRAVRDIGPIIDRIGWSSGDCVVVVGSQTALSVQCLASGVGKKNIPKRLYANRNIRTEPPSLLLPARLWHGRQNKKTKAQNKEKKACGQNGVCVVRCLRGLRLALRFHGGNESTRHRWQWHLGDRVILPGRGQRQPEGGWEKGVGGALDAFRFDSKMEVVGLVGLEGPNTDGPIFCTKRASFYFPILPAAYCPAGWSRKARSFRLKFMQNSV